MARKTCRVCGLAKAHNFDTMSKRGDKVYRDEKGKRWYNAVCADCQYKKQRTCNHCGNSLPSRKSLGG